MASRLLFTPLKVGNASLQQRIALAPLTRYRATDEHVPTPMMREYYRQRASVPGTLLITEGTFIAPSYGGYGNVPEIYTDEQIAAWKTITDAVHANGSYISCQLWALGFAANPTVAEREGFTIRSSSAVRLQPDRPIPEAMTGEQVRAAIQAFVQGAKNAIAAGFDMVEVHGAHGYLVDQFIQDTVNKRDDEWGGSIENRSRFAVEVVKAVAEAVGPERTAIRLSPWSKYQSIRMEDTIPQFSDVLRKLNGLGLAYLQLTTSRVAPGNVDVDEGESLEFVFDLWDGPIVVTGGFTPDNAAEYLEKHRAKSIVLGFGRHFIANPDLPFRLREGIKLHPYDRPTFYKVKSEDGYIDQPFSEEFLRRERLPN
ncbi:FMN-linked oxidoreductase [Thozetella sp. PMI_491]|nr:FMN-linked oxidoreductase [Thozetella sp. PMI_491]